MKNINSQRIVCIIQARMGSSRFPGKVLQQLCGYPMVGWVARRAKRAALIDQVVVATTTNSMDDAVAEFCQMAGITCFRGDEFDVLDRYYHAAIEQRADIVVRLTADCPLIDPQLIDEAIKTLIQNELDFTANRLPPPYKRTYPIGLDVEVASFRALEQAWWKAEKQYEREHVMPYLYDPENHFRLQVLEAASDLSQYRWTVDMPEDFQFIQAVIGYMDCREDFSWLDVVDILEKHPELLAINAGVRHKLVSDVDQRAEKK